MTDRIGRMPRVLLVEDEPRNAALVLATLEPAGYAVSVATTVDAARAAIEVGLPDLILLDLRLPGESGHVFARHVRARPDGASVPILAVTASVLEVSRREAIESGCNDVIEKPISPRDLLARVADLLAQGSAGMGE